MATIKKLKDLSNRNYDTMNQKELRAAMKAKGISYRGMKVAEMREALRTSLVEEQHYDKMKKRVDDFIAKDTQAKAGYPKAGGKCRAIWDALDRCKSMPVPTFVREMAREEGWNENNAVCELYAWRKHHGITGRVKQSQPNPVNA